MTRKGEHPLPEVRLKRWAMLVHLHYLTNPRRLAQRNGVSEEYIRRQYRTMEVYEMASVREALSELGLDPNTLP